MGNFYGKEENNTQTKESNPSEKEINSKEKIKEIKYEDKFKWGNYIGGGSFGKVYEVEYNGIKYAGKKIPKTKLITNHAKKALERELEILSIMNSCINSVHYYSNFEDKDNEILILELGDCDLEEIIIKNNGLDENQIFIIMEKLNDAFEKMQINNIIHRDIKPENIIIKFKNNESEEKYINQEFIYYPYNKKGFPLKVSNYYLIENNSNKKIEFNNFEQMIPKISDYGLSRQIENINLTKYVGSPIYMAPEVICSNKYNSKADLWSIGIMLYYMYFKEYPFDIPDFDDPNDIRRKYNKNKKKNIQNKNLDDLVNKLLVYTPYLRINWREYFTHPFFTNKFKKRFSGKQYIEIRVKACSMKEYNDKIYLLNDGNCDDFIISTPNKFTELNEGNTDMYIDGIQTKFKKFIYQEKENKNKEKIIKYVFDHKLKRLDYMFFACYEITSVKFVNVDISLVKSMQEMFSACLQLKNVSLKSCFNSKNLTNICNSFHYCPQLQEIDLSNIDFSNVESYDMFLVEV